MATWEGDYSFSRPSRTGADPAPVRGGRLNEFTDRFAERQNRHGPTAAFGVRLAPLRAVEEVGIDGVLITVVGSVLRHGEAALLRVLQHHRDEARPVFDEAPRHQAALPPDVPAVALAQLLRLARQVER